MRADGLVSITSMTELPDRQRGVSRELPGAGPDGDDAWADARATLLKALADPTRLSMVAALRRASAPLCICGFTAADELTQPTISPHMARLRAAGALAAS